jgi:hypothetical protein
LTELKELVLCKSTFVICGSFDRLEEIVKTINDIFRASELLNFVDAAVLCGVSRQAVYAWANPKIGRIGKDGTKLVLPTLEIVGFRMIRRKDFEQFLANVR